MTLKTIAPILIICLSGQVSAGQPSDWVAWAPGCHDKLLGGEFDLAKAPELKVPDAAAARIKQVIDEMRRDYGGTLVTAPAPDEVLDSVPFLTQYLRAFAKSGHDLSTYNYRFERILDRLSQTPKVLEDKRLDWDIWRAYLEYENFTDGTGIISTDSAISTLNSAQDLLWTYLEMNAKAITSDPERMRWWLTQLTQDLRAPGGRPLRRWFLLLLASSKDTLTDKIMLTEKPDAETIQPTPRYPFLILESLLEDDKQERPFAKTLEAIAASQQLKYVVWGLNPEKMPAAKSAVVSLGRRLTHIYLQRIIDQESWSKERQSFSPSYSSPVGRRAARGNVHLPGKPSDDGVFFFTFDACLYVWPKSQMDAAAIQMLRVSKVIDQQQSEAFMTQGFRPLKTTLKSR